MNFSLIKKNSFLFILFFIVFGLYAMTKGQEISFDFENYHFYNGFAFLHHRLTQDYAPAGIQSYFNPLLDVFNFIFVFYINNPILLRFVLGGICGLNGFFLFKISQYLFLNFYITSHSRLKIWASVIIGMSVPIVLSQIGSVMNDAQSALFAMIGLFFIIKAFDKKQLFNYLIAGLFLGIGMGLKLTNAVYIFSAILGVFIYLIIKKENFLMGLASLIFGSLAGFLITDGWWAWQLYYHFANPFFPYYNNIFHSPDYVSSTVQDGRFGVHSLGEALRLPFRLMHKNTMIVVEPFMRDWHLGMLFIFALLFLIKYLFSFLKQKKIFIPDPWIFLIIFTFSSYFIWVFEFGIYRYALPFLMTLGPCLVFFIDQLFQKIKLKNYLLILMILVLIGTNRIPDFGHVNFAHKRYYSQFFSITTSNIPDNSMVIISAAGTSFLIPYFNSKAQFVNPYFPGIMQDSIAKKMIVKHQGPFYILLSPVEGLEFSVQDFYTAYHFRQGPCQSITSSTLLVYQYIFHYKKNVAYEICQLLTKG